MGKIVYWSVILTGLEIHFSSGRCKELLSDTSLKLSGWLVAGSSKPLGTGHIADKRVGY
jgi:hypothetical protein